MAARTSEEPSEQVAHTLTLARRLRYVTVVGGTRLYPNDTIKDPESAMQVNLTAFNIANDPTGPEAPPYDLFASNGGFSNDFTRPSYQASAVANYLAKYAPDVPYYIANVDGTNIGANGGVYNRAGRGYPDVAGKLMMLIYLHLTLRITNTARS